VQAAIDQAEGAAGESRAGSARDEDLVGASRAHHARCGMDVESADFFATSLTRAGVDASPAAQTERADGEFDGERAADCRARGVEDCEEAVTGRVDFASVASLQRTTHDRPIAGQQRVPTLVAQAHHVLRRPDDVGEQEAEGGRRHGVRIEVRRAHCA
jgi:hypothetical protein